jgi:hypothetical protein
MIAFTVLKSTALGNEVGGTGRRLVLMVSKYAFLDFPIGDGKTIALSQVLSPGFHDKRLSASDQPA